MIWALLAVYFFGGGAVGGSMLTPDSVKAMSKRVDDVIVEPERAKVAEENFDALRDEVKSFNKTFRKSGKQLEKLYEDHSSDTETMLVALHDLNVEWDAAQSRAIDLRFELKDSMSAVEWAAVVSVEQANNDR